MRRAERTLVRLLAGAAVGVGISLTGCSAVQQPSMDSDRARVQLSEAVEAVQSATGADWVVEVSPGPIDCESGLERMRTLWRGTATVDREAAYAAVSRALEAIGHSAYTLAPNSTTPYIGSQGEGGFGLTFSYPIEGGPLNLSVSSDCFPLEEWPDDER